MLTGQSTRRPRKSGLASTRPRRHDAALLRDTVLECAVMLATKATDTIVQSLLSSRHRGFRSFHSGTSVKDLKR
jgi:hypothetical protein